MLHKHNYAKNTKKKMENCLKSEERKKEKRKKERQKERKKEERKKVQENIK